MDRRQFLAAVAASSAAAASPFAMAQDWPANPVRWVVPYPPGGGTDVLARTVAESMRKTLNQTIVVDNRPGASTNIGGQMVASAKPDGYTIMSADNAILAFNEHLFSKLPFSPDKDFTYVGGISRFPMALVVNPAFEAKDFKEFIRISGMTHVRTSPYYPQSNGKLERFHATIKGECIRPGVPLSLDDARRMAERFINHYNNVRLHSAIGYIAPMDKLNGRDQEIFKERDRKLEKARELRKKKRLRAYDPINPKGDNTPPPNPLGSVTK